MALGRVERQPSGLNTRVPRERRGHYDVAVVGLGPTGAVLANLLGLCGLRVVALEREADICRLPRAVHFDGEVMRIFQTIGVADRVAAVSRINAGMRFVDPDGRLILDWPRPQQVGPRAGTPATASTSPTWSRSCAIIYTKCRTSTCSWVRT